MRGSKPYLKCSCRDPVTRRTLGRKCPKLRDKGHARGWFFRYDAPRAEGEKRRQPEVGPFPTQKEAQEELTTVLARISGGGQAPDRSLRVGEYLDSHLDGKRNLKQRSRATDEEAFRLYWKPALGHMRLVDVRDSHVSDVVTAMEMINRPGPEKTRPEVAEMLRRMIAARADDERRVLPEGEVRHKKSTKPLSPARITRMFAPYRAAMNAAVPRKIMISPCDGVELPRADPMKPLAWTPPREARFRAALEKRGRVAGALEGRVLTKAEWQAIWADPDLRPAPAMVWMPSHTGQFLDYLDETGERLAALFILTAFCGLRRDEVLGLTWSEVDLEQGVAYIRETGSGSGPKSEAGVRVIPLPEPVVAALRAWRKVQAGDRLAWGPDWPGTDRVFTREDGSDVPAQWTSVRFEILAHRSGLPPVRFHDLRHGTASLLKAAGVDTKVISAILGHARTSFTDSVYVTLFPEIQKAAAEAVAAVVPRARKA
jgi:integrase